MTGRSTKSSAVILSFGESGLFFILIVMILLCVHLLYDECAFKWGRNEKGPEQCAAGEEKMKKE